MTPAPGAPGGGLQAALLPDGRRLHLQHGPIDLIIEAFGAPDQVRSAYRQAADRFRSLLDELVSELPLLRRPLGGDPPPLAGAVARRMLAACLPHAGVFLTPMAAVAGAVADEVLAALRRDRDLARAYVNDGGDIAVHLAPGERFEVGIVADLRHPAIVATATIDAAAPVRGIATSGQGGRSFSFGIADAVTVLARTAAAADVAATLIANSVDIESPAIRRRPACDLQADTDLGDRAVVVAVGPLSDDDVAAALRAGLVEAQRLQAAGLIAGAWLGLRGRHCSTGLTMPAVEQGGSGDGRMTA